MKLFDADSIASKLDYSTLIEALREGFRSEFTSPVRQAHETNTSDNSKLFLLKPAWDDKNTVIKLLTVNASNPQQGRPFIQGVIVIFDKETGAPLGVMDAVEITNRRTAAASALAADYLARSDTSVLTIIGTGALSSYMAHAHAAVRPITKVNVVGRSAEKAEAVAARISAENPKLNASAASDKDEATAEADILSTVTSSREPVINGAAVSAGTHVDLVGAFRPDTRESDDAAVAKSRVYVDTKEAALQEAGDILIPIQNGVMTVDDVQGDLADLCREQIDGRRNDDEVTLFKSVGTALEDLIAARIVVE